MNSVIVHSVNHVRTLNLVEQERFDIGLFPGVDTVDSAIIDAFGVCCLSAHTAPLPQCRGASALIYTLAYGLQPAATLHVATAGIDEGEILRVTPLPLGKNDGYDSINLRLTLQCADTPAEVAQDSPVANWSMASPTAAFCITGKTVLSSASARPCAVYGSS